MRPDVVEIARELLGMVVVTLFDGQYTAGKIVETEAYAADDKASHSHSNRRTRRTEPMFGAGGTSYVYRCYGIHHLFNIATNIADVAEAVLIRGIEPLEGAQIMQARRGLDRLSPKVGAGPGNVTVALGISGNFTGKDVFSDLLWIEDRGLQPPPGEIATGPRAGVLYAGEDARLPYRFWIRDNPWVSKPPRSAFPAGTVENPIS